MCRCSREVFVRLTPMASPIVCIPQAVTPALRDAVIALCLHVLKGDERPRYETEMLALDALALIGVRL